MEEGHERATRILTARRPILDRLAALLEEKEVIGGEEVKRIVGKGSDDST